MRWYHRLFRRARTERRLDAELRFHLEQQIADYVAAGMAPEEARRRARLDFGGLDQVKKECRDVGVARLVETLIQDLRYGMRQLRRNPGFTAVAIVTLAVGIGATTAIFSVVNTVLLEPLPYPNANRIVQLVPSTHILGISVPEFMAMLRGTPGLQNFSLFTPAGADANLTGGDRPQQIRALRVSASYFQLFGASMAVGRPFISAEDDRPGGPHVMVISYGLWRSRYGGDPGIIGKAIELSGEPYVVTGVLGRTFRTQPAADICLPLQADPNSTDPVNYLRGAAMMKPGATLTEVNAQLMVVTNQFRRKFPGAMASPGDTFMALPMREVEVRGIRRALLILFGAVSFVLLIACANVANLLLARATLRKREIAIRAAVGAGRKRIIRQLLTESFLLSLAGSGTGLVFGFVGLRALLAINPGNIPRIGVNRSFVTLDWRVLVFTIAVCLLTGILFGLIPAFHSSRSDLNAALKESGAWSGSVLRQNKFRSILVVSEMALALVLLAGSALLIRTLVAMRRVNPGFDPHSVLTMGMALTGPRFKKTVQVAQMVREAEQQVGSVPGVVAVSAAWSLPLKLQFSLPFTAVGRRLTGKSPYTGGGQWSAVSPEFFGVFRIPLIRGRLFTEQDDTAAPGVAIIDESMARKYWPKGNAIGTQIVVGKGMGPEFNEPPREIVGVVGDVRDFGLNYYPRPMMYVPIAQVTGGVTSLIETITPVWWAIRTCVPPSSLSREIGRRLLQASDGLPVAQIQPMDQSLVKSTAQTNFNMTLLTIFATFALLLAAVGIYGVIAYSVQQRTHEIGIRMALGATQQGVRRMVIRQGVTLALIGVGIGAVAAFWLTRLIAKMLYGVKASDPVVFVSVAILLSLVALIAAYIPARRAARVDPMVALRHE
ncbi:MAG TPA: ABC transporter permease [Terriglobia bacterium]|nr:ABC transporter permease [Terriglobia bacterium]